jgi:CRISPR/Cas system CMR-associated protein Cmr3 (group 5 of RAMP superfamily)
VRIGPVVAACIGRHAMIGGWDSLQHSPVAMRAALPAGSVLFIEDKEPPPEEPLKLGERTAFGYGRCRLGRWPLGWETWA